VNTLRTRFSASGRVMWVVADQALASVTNFALVVLVARYSSASAFGGFSLLFAAWLVASGVSRTLHAEPLTVRHADAGKQEQQRATTAAFSASAAYGFLVALLLSTVSVFVQGDLRLAVLVLACGLPALLTQDFCRAALVLRRRGRSAFINDAVFAVVMTIVACLAIVNDQVRLPIFLFAWCAGALAGSLLALLQLSILPSPSAAVRWYRNNLRIGSAFSAEFLLTQTSDSVVLFVLAGLGGLPAAGAFRAAHALFGPLNVLLLGIRLALAPELVRLWLRMPLRFPRAVHGMAAALAAAAVMWSLALLAIPAHVGTGLLGASYAGAAGLVLLVGVERMGSATILAFLTGLRTLQSARRSLVARFIMAVTVVSLGSGGAALAGARGTAVGLAVAACLCAPLWAAQFRWALREQEPRSTPRLAESSN
jgi:hypothetical protein